MEPQLWKFPLEEFPPSDEEYNPSNIYVLLYQRKFKDESLIVLNLKKSIKDTGYTKYMEYE